MKWNKLTTLAVGITATTIIAFNNLTQLLEKMIIPQLNKGLLLGFGIIFLVILIYAKINKKLFK